VATRFGSVAAASGLKAEAVRPKSNRGRKPTGQLSGDRFFMTKTGERRIENNMTGFKLATSAEGVRPQPATRSSRAAPRLRPQSG
jgi:hypothetical protein